MMKEKAVLTKLLRERVQHLMKSIRGAQRKANYKALHDIWLAAERLKQTLAYLESCFAKTILKDATRLLENITELLEQFRAREMLFRMVSDLMRNGRSRSKGMADGLVKEVEDFLRVTVIHTTKELRKVKPQKLGRDLTKSFLPSQFVGFDSLTKTLNQERQSLFNQVVKLIRTSQKEDLEELWHQNRKFYRLLELLTEAGFQKGKRLLRILEVLHERLESVCDQEMFRQFTEDLARVRIRDPEKVADIQVIRVIQNRLGVREADSIQRLHSHLPSALRLLKKPLAWKQ